MKSRRLLAPLLTTVLTVGASHAIATEMMVLESIPSDSPFQKGQILTLKNGQIYRDETPFTLPKPLKVRVVLCDGKTLLLEQGKPIPKLSQPANSQCQFNLFTQAKKKCRRLDTSTMPDCEKRGDDTSRHNVWMIDVSTSATYCVRKGRKIRVWRPEKSRQATQLLLTHQTTPPQSVTVTWRGRRATLRWPSKMPIVDGGVYTAKLGASEAKTLTLRQLPTELSTNAMKMIWMAENGCMSQARRLFEVGDWDE